MVRSKRLIGSLLLAAGVATPITASAPVAAAPGDPLTLNIFHVNDHHSHLDPDSGSVDLGAGTGGEFDYELGGWGRVEAKINELEAAHAGQNNVKIHAGDAITGTLYYTLFEGQADAEMMNLTCFDVFEVGNHEFDQGDAQLVKFLDFLNNPDGDGDDTNDACNAEVLGGNVKPAAGTPLNPNPDAAVTADDYLKPYVIEDYGVDKVGFVGIDISGKTRNSSSPLPTTEFLDEVETTQKYVDELAAQGIKNIVLVSHYQYDNDIALARNVTGVDAIIGGDSHTLLGNAGVFGEFAPETGGNYPTKVTNKSGENVCVVQAWQYAAVVGELELSFADGKLTGCTGTPHMLVGEYTRDDADGNSQPITDPAELTAINTKIAAIPGITAIEPDAAVISAMTPYKAEIERRENDVIAQAGENLCLNRLPGDTRSSGICATDEVALSGARADANGGFIQQIVTDAFNASSLKSDIALQNAGGVRIAIPEGPISIATVYELLPFANTLVELSMTGAEINQVLEEAVANFVDIADGSNGSYPYGSAIRWDVDLSKPAGERFSNIEVRDDAGTWSPIDPAKTYTVVTNNFLASGQDGWNTFGTVSDRGDAVNTYIDYAQAFIDYINAIETGDAIPTLSVPEPSEFSTQSFVPVEGRTFAPVGPIRLLETRTTEGDEATIDGHDVGSGLLKPAEPYTLQVGGRSSVPPTATAVALNLTVTDTTGPGYLTVWPCDGQRPLASSINYTGIGQTIANSIVVPLSAVGTVCIESGVNATEVVVDATGWSAASDGFKSVNPIRIADSRPAGDSVGKTYDNQLAGTGRLSVVGGEPLKVAVTGRVEELPETTTAVVVNVAATDSQGPGYVVAWPCGGEPPLSSSLNYTTANTSVSNSLIVPLAADGTFCLASGVDTPNVVVDLTGAFTGIGEDFGAVTPARFVDTRPVGDGMVGTTFDGVLQSTGIVEPGNTFEIAITGRGVAPEGAPEGEGVVPSSANLVSVNLAVVDATGPGFLTVWDCVGDPPLASSINYDDAGTTIANSVLVPLSSDGKICIQSGVSATHLIADVNGYVQ